PVTLSMASRRGTDWPTTVKPPGIRDEVIGSARSAGRGCGTGQDRLDDLLVARAAAETSPQEMRHLLGRRVGLFVEQRLRREQHPRGAEPALQRAVLDERRLERVKRPRDTQPLDCEHVAPV